MIIKGWVNPKYLDEDWYSSLSFNLNKKMATEVPAVLSVNTKSYLGAKLTSSILSYGDLEDKVSLQKQFIKKLEQKNKILMEALEFYADHLNHNSQEDIEDVYCEWGHGTKRGKKARQVLKKVRI